MRWRVLVGMGVALGMLAASASRAQGPALKGGAEVPLLPGWAVWEAQAREESQLVVAPEDLAALVEAYRECGQLDTAFIACALLHHQGKGTKWQAWAAQRAQEILRSVWFPPGDEDADWYETVVGGGPGRRGGLGPMAALALRNAAGWWNCQPTGQVGFFARVAQLCPTVAWMPVGEIDPAFLDPIRAFAAAGTTTWSVSLLASGPGKVRGLQELSVRLEWLPLDPDDLQRDAGSWALRTELKPGEPAEPPQQVFSFWPALFH